MKKLLPLLFIVLIGVVGYFLFAQYTKDKPTSSEKITPTAVNSDEKPSANQTVVSTQKTATTNSKSSTDKAPANYTPSFWIIEHKGKKSYLFGSIHLGDKSMYPLPEKIMSAFEQSDTLAVEIDMTKIDQIEIAQMVQTMAIDMENPLPTVLSERTKKEYDAFCEKQKATCNMIKPFEPWMAAMTLEVIMIGKAGYKENLGIDNFFLRSAKNKEVVELESFKAQLTMLDQMPAELQDFMMLGALIKEQDDIDEMFAAWKQGNIESILDKAEAEARELNIPEEIIEQFNDIFLYKRNQVMADGIANLINQGKSVFAVVGAAHYVGDKSVIDYLEEKGFTVQKQ